MIHADAELRECRQCGLFQHLPPLVPGHVAECPRCGHVLRRARRDLIDRTLALCLAGLMLYAVAVAFPFLDFIVGGRTWTMSLPTLPGSLEAYGLWQLALVMVVGYLAAVLVFVPAYLLFIARARAKTTVIYTLVLGAALLALPSLIPVDLPTGLLG